MSASVCVCTHKGDGGNFYCIGKSEGGGKIVEDARRTRKYITGKRERIRKRKTHLLLSHLCERESVLSLSFIFCLMKK